MESKQRQFEALVTAYSSDLYRYAYWMCHNAALAEDLVQETFLRAWKSIESLRDYQLAKSWLITILRRETARYFERHDKPDTSLEDINLNSMVFATREPDHSDVFILRQGLAQLSDEYREVLLLQVVAGFSCDEIATQLAIKPGAVMTRLFRARQKLRNWYEDHDGSLAERKVE